MLQSTALAACLGPLTGPERRALLSNLCLQTLQGVFRQVNDPHSGYGHRYPLPFLLTCLVAALLCGCNSLEAVGPWCAEHPELLRRMFGPQRHLSPTGALYRWLLPQLVADEIEWALASWVQATRTFWDRDPLLIDGKIVRGAHTATTSAPHLLSVSTAQSRGTRWATLIQVRVPAKTNEIPVAQDLLRFLPLSGRVCLADALHTQTTFAQAVCAYGGHYLLTVKGNQPTLQADLAGDPLGDFTAPTDPDCTATTCERHRGRVEQRTIGVSTAMTAYLSPTWPSLAQVAQLIRTVSRSGTTQQEIVYLITSLPVSTASPHDLLTLVRSHWQIENSRHYVRDVTFGEAPTSWVPVPSASGRCAADPGGLAQSRHYSPASWGHDPDCRGTSPLCLSSPAGIPAHFLPRSLLWIICRPCLRVAVTFTILSLSDTLCFATLYATIDNGDYKTSPIALSMVVADLAWKTTSSVTERREIERDNDYHGCHGDRTPLPTRRTDG